MNSTGRVLAGFEWDYDGTVSIMRGTGYQGKGVSRTLFLNNPKLEEIPEQLFAVKISKSTNPSRAGKVVFKYFSFRFNPEAKYENIAPENVTMDMELTDIKALIIAKMVNFPQVEISLNINLPGKFTNITCADGTYALYDENKPEFASEDPTKSGNAPYYIKGDANVHVKLKGAASQNNEYLQVTLSTTATANEIFQKMETGKVWGGSDDMGAGVAAPTGNAGAATGSLW